VSCPRLACVLGLAIVLTIGTPSSAVAAETTDQSTPGVRDGGLAPMAAAPIQREANRVVVEETAGLLSITWAGRDGKFRRLLIDRKAQPGVIRGLLIDRDGSGTFDTPAENLLPAGQLDWWIVVDNQKHRLALDTSAPCNIASEKSRTSLTFQNISLGPVHADLQLTFFAGSNLFVCELDIKGAAGNVDVEQVGTGVREFRAGPGEPIVEFARYELDTSTEGQDMPTLQRYTFSTSNETATEGPERRNYYKASCLSGPAGSLIIEPPPHLGWYHSDPYYVDRPGLDADAGIVCFDYNTHRLKEKLQIQPNAKKHFVTVWHVETEPAEKALDATYAFQNHQHYPKLAGYKVLIADTDMADPKGVLYARSAGVNFFCATVNDGDFFGDCFKDPDFLSAWAIFVDAADPRIGKTDPKWTEHVKKMSIHNNDDFVVCVHSEIDAGWLTSPSVSEPQRWISTHMGYIGPRRDSFFVARYIGRPGQIAREVASIGGITWLAHPNFNIDFLIKHWEPKLHGLAVNSCLMSSYPDQQWLFLYDAVQSRWLNQLDALWNAGCRPKIIGEADIQGFPGYTDASRYGSRIYPECVVNYVRVDQTKFEDMREAVRRGDYFVSTGEILMPQATLADVPLDGSETKACETKTLTLDLQWTYPLREIRVISNLGTTIYPPPAGVFGRQTVAIPMDTLLVRWLRVDVRDVANNYCLSQPIAIAKGERE